jgi:formylglycine-generating enzyme required for sulfatase activity
MRTKQVDASDKTSPDKISEAEDQVRLKPILGLRPGIYLAVIYSIILLFILFFILIYPGITRPGSIIILKTEPSGAALRVDGVYRGTAPDKIFVAKGSHTLELVLPGFTPERIECEIPGRIFASAIFPRPYPLEVKLNSPDPAAAFALAAADYAAWTFGGEPTAAWQIPLSLSDGAYRVGAQIAADTADSKAGNSVAMAELLRASARFAVTRAALRDMVRAKAITDNGGLPPSPLSVFNTAADIIGFLSENPGSAAWLAGLLPPESAALVTASPWYQNELAALAADTTRAPVSGAAAAVPPPARQLRLGGLSFTGIDGGTLVQGEPSPHRVSVSGFMVSDTEVSAAAFEAFLAAKPQWREDQRDALIKQELVTGDYLRQDAGGRTGESGITAVSWFAAQAFCQWLGEQLPPALAGCEVRLPTEAEWEYAAKNTNSGDAGMWEWCADPYAPLAFITAAPDAIAAIGSPDRSVRGRPNSANSAGAETRASLPPAFCSPFVSFRPVIVQRR